MKTCLDCGKDLPTPLDEFGDLGQERCVSHFLEFQWNKPNWTIEALTEMKDELESKKESLEDIIWYLRNCHEYPGEEEINMYSAEKREIIQEINKIKGQIREQRQIIKVKLDDWKNIHQGEIICP